MFAFGFSTLMVVTFGALSIGFIWVIAKCHNYFCKNRKYEKYEEPGIIATYIKAYKEKYCPSLEITE